MADFINARVIQKIATVSEWSTSTIIPYKGEIMLVSDGTGKVVNIKVGDGINHFNDLPYMFENMSNFNVSDAGDVSVAGRTDGQVLSWNSDINKWVARNEQSLAGYATQAWVMSVGFLTEYDADLLYKPINWFPEWDEITDKPTTLAGFGITDVYTKSESDARYLDTLQSVTDRGNSTSLDISVRGVQLTDFLGLPTTPPDPSDVLSGRSYVWIGDGAEAGVPIAGTLAGLEDVQLSSLTNGQSLVWNASTLKWENATISSGGGTWGSITGVLSNQTDLQLALNNRELVANKATGFSVLNNTLYPTTQAVANYVGNGTLSISAGTGLTGSGSFSANQSSNASISIGLSAATQSDIAKGVTAHGWGDYRQFGLGITMLNSNNPNSWAWDNISVNSIHRGTDHGISGISDNIYGISLLNSSSSKYGIHIAGHFTNRLFIQGNSPSNTLPWVEIWHSGNLRSNAQNDARYMQVTKPANSITSGDITNWNTAYAQRHTHSNKAFLDTINQNLSTSSSVEFDKIKIVSLMSIPTSAPTSPVSGEAYIWVEMD